jgi:hypothetical protein
VPSPKITSPLLFPSSAALYISTVDPAKALCPAALPTKPETVTLDPEKEIVEKMG